MTDPATKRIPLFTIAVGAAILGFAPWALPHRSDSAPPTASDEAAVRQTVRVARETTPTIVESNANWLESPDARDMSESDIHRETVPSLLAPLHRDLYESVQR